MVWQQSHLDASLYLGIHFMTAGLSKKKQQMATEKYKHVEAEKGVGGICQSALCAGTFYLTMGGTSSETNGCQKISRTDGETLQPSGVTEYVNMAYFMTCFNYKL